MTACLFAISLVGFTGTLQYGILFSQLNRFFFLNEHWGTSSTEMHWLNKVYIAVIVHYIC